MFQSALDAEPLLTIYQSGQSFAFTSVSIRSRRGTLSNIKNRSRSTHHNKVSIRSRRGTPSNVVPHVRAAAVNKFQSALDAEPLLTKHRQPKLWPVSRFNPLSSGVPFLTQPTPAAPDSGQSDFNPLSSGAPLLTCG
jgi:hypothetical protein